MGMRLGRLMDECWKILEWNRSWQCQRHFSQKVSSGSQVGNLDKGLAIKYQVDPSWGICIEFCSEIMKKHPTRIVQMVFGGQMGR